MTCGLIMTGRLLTAHAEETVAEAAARLVEQGTIDLPVVDRSGKFLGMFGIADIFNLVVPKIALAGDLAPNLRFMGDDAEELRTRFRKVGSRKVGDAARRDVRVVHPDTPEIEALRLFGQQYSTLAVVARETRMLLGVVSYRDALGALTGLGRQAAGNDGAPR